MNSMLENLNDEQKAAVEAVCDGPVLVTAGAGTGKTSVLISATTRLLVYSEEKINPWEVLVVTFTNKAANEIKNRIQNEEPKITDMNWLGTFHSVCLKILRRNAGLLGLRNDFLIYGEDEQKAVLKTILENNGDTRKTLAPFIEKFSRIKDKGIEAFDEKDKLYTEYNAELRRLGGLDFGDIILFTIKLFKENPDVLQKYQKQFKYILVDEFQDTNGAQMELLKLLTQGQENPHIYCVGDEDQSIYSWRGAEIKNIVDFKKTFPNAIIKRLETNYRSTGNILNAANSLIVHNKERYAKVLHTVDGKVDGEPVYVLTVPTDKDEARVIAEAIARDGNNFSNTAILIRTGSLSRLFEEEFTRRGIPYRLVGATKFYDRMEIRDAIAYLRLLVYPFDDISFLRIIGKPRRGFGPSAIDKLRASGPNLMSGLRTATLSGKQRVAADEFLDAFKLNWMDMAPRDAAQTLLEKSGYLQMWRDSKDADSTDRLDNIRELIVDVIAKYDTLPEFLEQAALMTTDDDEADKIGGDKNAVSIMTIHAAKGLEFNTVFLPAWEEGVFPNEKSVDEGSIEEERRLAYVAITRARNRCVILNTMSRLLFGEVKYNAPSRFITEMDGQYLDFQGGAPRNYNASYRAPMHQHTHRAVAPETMVGKLVSHVELGRGTVIAENGDVLTVAFGKHGIKNVMKSFVSIAD